MCLIFTGNKWELASISRKGRKPCKRWLISSVSRGQNPLVLKNNLLLHKFISKLTETNNFKSYPEIEIFYFQCQLSCCWAEGFKVNCPLMGPGRIGGVSSVGVFLRDPSQYLSEFRRKPRENSERLGQQVWLGIDPGTSRLPASKCRITLPLMGPRTDSFNIHVLPGIRTQELWCSSRLP